LRDADLAAGDGQAARARYAEAFPELLGATPPKIDRQNYRAAVALAVVLQKTGDRDRADQLLDRSERFIRTLSRLGEFGYGITDVQIFALRGQKPEALAALRAAETAMWRGPSWRYYRDFDPALASIRGEPEFKAVFADIERNMARQLARLAARPKDAPLDLGAVH
jgi:predicted ThiF/HesA family dinucleotide-utilizing enzyme